MANFEEAYPVLQDEGGYANDPRDRGGETYRGISRKFHPSWPGWARIDQLKATCQTLAELKEALKADAVLNAFVKPFYRDEFWKPIYDRVNSQAIATKLFDLGVNENPEQATKLLQSACNDCGEMVAVDGTFGNITLNAVNSADSVLLLTAFKRRAVEFYQHIVARDASQSRFLIGWCKRAMA